MWTLFVFELLFKCGWHWFSFKHLHVWAHVSALFSSCIHYDYEHFTVWATYFSVVSPQTHTSRISLFKLLYTSCTHIHVEYSYITVYHRLESQMGYKSSAWITKWCLVKENVFVEKEQRCQAFGTIFGDINTNSFLCGNKTIISHAHQPYS